MIVVHSKSKHISHIYYLVYVKTRLNQEIVWSVTILAYHLWMMPSFRQKCIFFPPSTFSNTSCTPHVA
jgi:hypothetical protein